MRKYHKTCVVCGKEYEYCPNCAKYNTLPKWHTIFHDENCKTIFEICNSFVGGDITKEEAKAALAKCDLKNMKAFTKSIQQNIRDIQSADKKVALPKAPAEQ